MKWVKDKPTKEGWYWVKRAGMFSGQPYVRPVHVYHSKMYDGRNEWGEPDARITPDGVVDTVYEDGDNYRLRTYEALEWGDEPLPEPEPKFEGKVVELKYVPH